MSRPRRRSESEADARRAVVETAQAMSRAGLSPARSGNVSRRWKDGLLVTPSGVRYDVLRPREVVFVGADGRRAARGPRPSSETPFHLAVYRARPDVGAVVHAHSLHATALACAHRPIPAFHYMVAAAGGADVPLVPYATFGSDDLARHVVAGLCHRDACLIANHGQVAVGADLASALELAEEVEALAAQYVAVLSIGGARVLDGDEMARVLARFEDYGPGR